MAKLYAEMRSERGVERHQIANKQLCADFHYGSREESIHGFTVCATVMPDPTKETGCPEKVTIVAQFFSPDGYNVHSHYEVLPLCRKSEAV